VAKSAGL